MRAGVLVEVDGLFLAVQVQQLVLVQGNGAVLAHLKRGHHEDCLFNVFFVALDEFDEVFRQIGRRIKLDVRSQDKSKQMMK